MKAPPYISLQEAEKVSLKVRKGFWSGSFYKKEGFPSSNSSRHLEGSFENPTKTFFGKSPENFRKGSENFLNLYFFRKKLFLNLFPKCCKFANSFRSKPQKLFCKTRKHYKVFLQRKALCEIFLVTLWNQFKNNAWSLWEECKISFRTSRRLRWDPC